MEVNLAFEVKAKRARIISLFGPKVDLPFNPIKLRVSIESVSLIVCLNFCIYNTGRKPKSLMMSTVIDHCQNPREM